MAVEFSLLLPVIIMLSFGVIEFGRMLWIQSTLQYAVDQTARFAIVNPTATAVDLKAYAATQISGFDPATVTITATPVTVGGVDFMDIIATTTFSAVTAYVPAASVSLKSENRVPLVR
ncbi:MAG: TadE/TadG family type IV pilus assembly protein [Alphaproteobacteria bacterium]